MAPQRSNNASTKVTCADISVNKVVTPRDARANEPVSFTITVTNSSPNTAKSIQFSDPLPSGFEFGAVEPSGGNKVRQAIGLRQGLPDDLAKKITKIIRDEFPKVKSQIQGDAVRVSGKSKDDLQRVITRLRALDEVVELQFQNYR